MEKENSVLSIKKIANTLILKKEKGAGLFISSNNSIVITIPNLCTILRYLVLNNLLSYKTLEGILEEYHSFSGEMRSFDE